MSKHIREFSIWCFGSLWALSLPCAVQGQSIAWKRSAAAAFAGTTADWVSSVGHPGRELNPNLTGPDGRFSHARAAGFKLGITSGLVVLEYSLMKKWPRLERPFSRFNWIYGGGNAALAIRNAAVR
jgi:hypothetical protein